MIIALIRVYHDQLPQMIIRPINYLVSTEGVAVFTIHSETDIKTIEEYQGPYQEEVRAMAADLHKLFPAEPEDEPELEYVLRHDEYEKAIPCRECGYLIETRWCPENSQYQCQVCIDIQGSGGYKQMNYQTNVILAEIRKSRPSERMRDRSRG